MKKINYLILLILLFSKFTLTGCRHHPECINEKSESLSICWGEQNSANGKINGYILNSYGEIRSVNQKESVENISEKPLCIVPGDRYCNILKLVHIKLVATQVLNTPGEVRKFVEYKNPEMNVNLRAIWNPEFQNAGNRGFSMVYDSLQVLINDYKDK